MDSNSNRSWSFLVCLALAFATAAVYCQVCSHDFVNYDDIEYIYENPNIQSGITLQAVKWALTTGYAANWHPLTWLSHITDWQLFGNKAGGHHCTNLVFHIANALLLFIVLKQMTSAFWQSAFVAALFALHPLHVESVAWVSERKDVLSTFFWLLTMWAYVSYVHCPKISRYSLVVLFLALGLMAKAMLVTLPFVLLLLDYWPLERFGRRTFYRLIWEKIPFFVLSAASSIATFLVQQSWGAVATTSDNPLRFRVSNVFISYVRYIEKMIWPAHLDVFYPPQYYKLASLQAIGALLVLLITSVLVLCLAARHRYLLTGWLWYLGTLVPVLGLVQVGSQAMADRYSYVTLTGLFIIVAWGIPELLGKWKYKKIALASAAMLVVSSASACTWFQASYWQNSITLFQHSLDLSQNNHIAHLHMAKALCESGKPDEGVKEYRIYLQMKPNDADVISNLGVELISQNRLDEGIAEYKRYLQIKPNDPNMHNDIGVALCRQGKLDEAVEYFTKALRIKPDFAAAHNNLGYTLALQGKLDEAVVHYNEALRLDPDYAVAHYELGRVLVRMGKINQAIGHFEDAMRLKPYWDEPANILAWYFAVSKDTEIYNPDEAVRLALHACELTNNQKPDFLDTLAAAYAAKGDFGKAVETIEKALALCGSPQQESLKKELESRLVLFKAGKPYVESQ